MTNQEYLTIKEAAQLYGRSEQTIRRLVKQHVLTSHVRSEDSPKGKAYQVSSTLLQQEYEVPTVATLPALVVSDSLQQENQQLRKDVAERDRTIQQLQNRLFEQGDIMNAMANQMTNQLTSQKMGHIEELLIQQNAQIGDLQQRLPAPGTDEAVPDRRSLWRRLFGR
ncbi:helix-turn-helix domain-containing protein [Fibrella sp. HMF5335]|uniref:Helix-turn-helix domain-containing protein n=1 Tax=Fibrella rubiginis TaxID=2817060 RepID=A0A939GME7_9BACT|nr:helix-turn-helix domain-containing protein [Fibrella rubiginis]MBO0940049.1 helix-turn-helix domain-containing protein [Fibrella rubiginis]